MEDSRILEKIRFILQRAKRPLVAREISAILIEEGIKISRSELNLILYKPQNRSESLVVDKSFRWSLKKEALDDTTSVHNSRPLYLDNSSLNSRRTPIEPGILQDPPRTLQANHQDSPLPACSNGVFVRIAESKDGVGKLVGLSERYAEVEYFISPVGPSTHRLKVLNSHLRQVELSPQTRIYWFDQSIPCWRIGRVDGGLVSALALRKTEDHYHIRFPNGEQAYLPISQIYIRWSHPIEDPSDYLATRITETPFFFEGRTRVTSYLAKQRASFGGLTGLASASIELLEHQITTVRRVVADPIQRYLLADEVGLGKTIEAGIIIRQHLIDLAGKARILVVVPSHLFSQWISELEAKFFLQQGKQLMVATEEELARLSFNDVRLTMIVVDEAHRSAVHAFSNNPEDQKLYSALCMLSKQVPRILLLSGTPVLHQEDGFLAMLHLLDPKGYRLEDRELFRRRVRDRQVIAEAIADLSDDSSSFFVEDAVAKLENLFGDDQRLMGLCQNVRLRVHCDANDASRIHALRSLRIHLTETYRLHRRLLRTRRDDSRVRDLLPERTGATVLEYEDHAREESIDFIESWRLKLSGLPYEHGNTSSELKALFALWVECALIHPRVLLRRIDARIALLTNIVIRSNSIQPTELSLIATPLAFDGEINFLEDRRHLLSQSITDEPRADRLVNWLQSNPEIRKVVVFADDAEVADIVSEILIAAFGENAIVRHKSAEDCEQKFQHDASIRILVCDVRAEEGLNLQKVGAAIVHYSLPLEATRIEQRIGRADRVEARGHFRNVVLFSRCKYELEWLACLNDTIRIFHRSVAALQYILLDATARIRARFLEDGSIAIEVEARRMEDSQKGIEAELRQIRAQEALDSTETDPERDREYYEQIEEVDLYAEEASRAFDAWVVGRLGFLHLNDSPKVFRYVHDIHHPTLVPLHETMTRFESCIDKRTDIRRSRYQLPLRVATFDRVVSQQKQIELLRIGHPFVDEMESLIYSDGRGTSFAMWRALPLFDSKEPQLFFRFDFVIEADLAEASGILASKLASPETLRRKADNAFPVMFHTISLNSDLEIVSDPSILPLIELPFNKTGRPDGGRDTNIRRERWECIDGLHIVNDWSGLCIRARDVAKAMLCNSSWFQEHCNKFADIAQERAIAVRDAFHSRIARLQGSNRISEEVMSEFEWQLSDALIRGIRHPKSRLDTCGAIFLSSEPFPEARND